MASILPPSAGASLCFSELTGNPLRTYSEVTEFCENVRYFVLLRSLQGVLLLTSVVASWLLYSRQTRFMLENPSLGSHINPFTLILLLLSSAIPLLQCSFSLLLHPLHPTHPLLQGIFSASFPGSSLVLLWAGSGLCLSIWLTVVWRHVSSREHHSSGTAADGEEMTRGNRAAQQMSEQEMDERVPAPAERMLSTYTTSRLVDEGARSPHGRTGATESDLGERHERGEAGMGQETAGALPRADSSNTIRSSADGDGDLGGEERGVLEVDTWHTAESTFLFGVDSGDVASSEESSTRALAGAGAHQSHNTTIAAVLLLALLLWTNLLHYNAGEEVSAGTLLGVIDGFAHTCFLLPQLVDALFNLESARSMEASVPQGITLIHTIEALLINVTPSSVDSERSGLSVVLSWLLVVLYSSFATARLVRR